MNTAAIQQRMAGVKPLADLQQRLANELALQADNVNYQFDPVLVVMIISILVQVIIHCR